MEWKKLLSNRRMRESLKPTGEGSKKSRDLRSEFEKDYHRIIGSASFRRLQDKTQVFPLDKSDFIRTRLTHSLEVSSIARSLGENIGECILSEQIEPDFTKQMKEDITNILQCAGLIHDIGNPPFGHFGEEAIREWFQDNLPKLKLAGQPVLNLIGEQMKEDLLHFEGNAQALRLVTKLHFLVDENGMNLTFALLNTIVKYPIPSYEINSQSADIRYKKMGYYFADEEIYQEIVKETGAKGCRHPLTFVLEAADDIAYKTADIEDAYIKGMISYQTLLQEMERLEKENPGNTFRPAEKLKRLYKRCEEEDLGKPEEYAVKNWVIRVQGYMIGEATKNFMENYQAIMAGTYTKDIFSGDFGEVLMKSLGDLAYRWVFTSRKIYRMETTEACILDFLMKRFVEAALRYDTKEPLNSIEKRMIGFISSNYKKAYHNQAEGKDEGEKLYLRLLLVTDYICGMTDSFAKRLFQELNGML